MSSIGLWPLDDSVPKGLHWTCCPAYRAAFIRSHDTHPIPTPSLFSLIEEKHRNPAYMALKAAHTYYLIARKITTWFEFYYFIKMS